MGTEANNVVSQMDNGSPKAVLGKAGMLVLQRGLVFRALKLVFCLNTKFTH